jgi:hypothetical protein
VTDGPDPAIQPLIAWLQVQPGCRLEGGLSSGELDHAEQRFGVRFPPLWRALLSHVQPVALLKPPRAKDGSLNWTAYPDWGLRDEAGTRELIDAPVHGVLFDVEHNNFWWAAWGPRPVDLAMRLSQATEQLATVPRLVPLWGHFYVGSTDDSPVFSIVQADLYVPAVTIADLPRARNQDAVPLDDWPIGNVPFWSQLHAWSQAGHLGPFAYLANAGL